MRKASIWLLLTVLCLGCYDAKKAQRAKQAQRKAVVNDLKQRGLAMHANQNVQQEAVVTVTHEVVTESEYYSTSPQQGRPSDGMFAAGTKVSVIKDAGNYVLARSAEGVEGYVTSEALTLLADDRSDVSD